jgi:hypothetical protein
LEAGASQETADDSISEVAVQFLDDMEAGLRFHRPMIENSRAEQAKKYPEADL